MPSLKPRLALAGLVVVALAQPVAVVAAESSPSPEPSSPSAPIGQACTHASRPFDPSAIHLTGAWSANDDGVYYIRQHGSDIAWNGMSDRARPAPELGRQWNNVAIGTLAADGTIDVNWMDVPRGGILGGGTLKLLAQADGSGNLEIRKIAETGTGFGGALFQPCQADPVATSNFNPGFSVRDDVGIGLGAFEDPGRFVMIPGDPYDSGISAWNITSESPVICTPAATTMKPGAAAFLDWLGSRSDLVVSDPVPVTVGGLSAMSVDVKPADGAVPCLDGGVPLWQGGGNLATVSPTGLTRVIALDVGDQVVAFELWGDHQDQWLPLAENLLGTLAFDGASP